MKLGLALIIVHYLVIFPYQVYLQHFCVYFAVDIGLGNISIVILLKENKNR